MTNSKKNKAPANRRLSPAEWIEAEELYRQGHTQAQIAAQFGIRVETVSRHMTKRNVKGGEAAEKVREELAAALQKKQRDFAESKAQRQIDSKELLYKMTNILVATFAKEMQANMASGKSLAALSGSAKALKDALLSMKLGREELYTILDIKDEDLGNQLPQLTVLSMSEDEEERLREQMGPEEDEDDDLVAEMQNVIESIEHQVAANG